MATLIAKLEGAVIEEKQILHLMTRKEEIFLSLSNCLESKQQCEKKYEAANNILSLIEASNLAKELSAYSANELLLITKLSQTSHGVDGTNQKLMSDRVKRQFNFPSRTKSSGEISISVRLDECRSELSSANKSISDILFKISSLEKEVGRLKAEYKDHENLEECVKSKIKLQIATIFEMGEELSLLLKVCEHTVDCSQFNLTIGIDPCPPNHYIQRSPSRRYPYVSIHFNVARSQNSIENLITLCKRRRN